MAARWGRRGESTCPRPTPRPPPPSTRSTKLVPLIGWERATRRGVEQGGVISKVGRRRDRAGTRALMQPNISPRHGSTPGAAPGSSVSSLAASSSPSLSLVRPDTPVSRSAPCTKSCVLCGAQTTMSNMQTVRRRHPTAPPRPATNGMLMAVAADERKCWEQAQKGGEGGGEGY